jgi:hypothetical protein
MQWCARDCVVKMLGISEFWFRVRPDLPPNISPPLELSREAVYGHPAVNLLWADSPPRCLGRLSPVTGIRYVRRGDTT